MLKSLYTLAEDPSPIPSTHVLVQMPGTPVLSRMGGKMKVSHLNLTSKKRMYTWGF